MLDWNYVNNDSLERERIYATWQRRLRLPGLRYGGYDGRVMGVMVVGCVRLF